MLKIYDFYSIHFLSEFRMRSKEISRFFFSTQQALFIALGVTNSVIYWVKYVAEFLKATVLSLTLIITLFNIWDGFAPDFLRFFKALIASDFFGVEFWTF